MSEKETTGGADREGRASKKDPIPKLRPVEAIHYKRGGQDMFCLRDPVRVSERELHVSPDVFMIASLFDGERSVADVQSVFASRFGMRVDAQNVVRVVEALEDARFLDGPDFEKYRAKVEDEFRRLDVRAPILAGSCYPEKPEEIRASLDAFFTEGEGASGAPAPRSGDSKPLRGLVVPHIDLRREGMAYAHAYKALWEGPLPEVVVLVGTAHAGRGDLFTFTRKDFLTPLGRVKNDVRLTERLAAAVGESAFRDEYTHRGEHSVEIQLVWLQHAAAKYGTEVPRIVPVLTGSLQEVIADGRAPTALGEMDRMLDALAEVLTECEGRVFPVASADLAHIGRKFGDEVPLTPRLLRKNREEDAKMLSFLQAGDADGFFEFVRAEEDRRRICGLASIYTCLAACARAAGEGGVSSEILCYDQAPDEETQSLVSYASLAIV